MYITIDLEKAKIGFFQSTIWFQVRLKEAKEIVRSIKNGRAVTVRIAGDKKQISYDWKLKRYTITSTSCTNSAKETVKEGKMHTTTITDVKRALHELSCVTVASSSGKKRILYDFLFGAYTVQDLNNEYNVLTTSDVTEAISFYNNI
jgi:hypothetical protein